MEAQGLEIQELGLRTTSNWLTGPGAAQAPEAFWPLNPSVIAVVPVAVMPMVMAPIMVAPVTIVTDAPRAVMGPDHPAAVIRAIIGIIVVGRRVIEVPVKTVMPECEPAVAESAAVETAAAVTTTAMTATVATSTAMTAAHFGRQAAGGVLRGRRGTRIDQRKRLRALARRGRQHQGRSGRKAPTAHETTDQTAPRIRNFIHA